MPSAAPELKPRRSLLRWLRRLLLAVTGVLLLLVVFHRPLLLALIQWAGPQGAATQGLPLAWKVRGSLWSDLTITELKTGGGESHWLPRATLGKLELTYDLRAELEHLVKSITLHDLEAEVDLRHLPKGEPAAPASAPEAAVGKAPPLLWPDFIDLKNLNANVTLADGKRIALRGFTLQIGRGLPGLLTCRELRVEPDGPNLDGLKAKVDWQPRLLVIRDFALPREVVLDELRLDLKHFEDGQIIANIAAHLGAAKFRAEAEVAGIFAAPMQVKVSVQASDLRALEMQTLGLPTDVQFDGGELDLQVEGDPTQPPKLKVSTRLEVANIRAAGALLDKVELGLHVKDARADLNRLQVTRGSNRVEVTAQAKLPDTIEAWPKTAWTAQAKADLAEVSQLLVKPLPLKGWLGLEAKAQGLGDTPTQVTGQVKGKALTFENYRLPELASVFALDGKEARLELPALPLGQGNEVALKATLKMQDAMPVKATWKVQVHDPAKLIDTVGLPLPPKPVQAKLRLEGHADLNVKDVSEGRFESCLAQVMVKLDEGRFGESPLPQLALEARTHQGQVQLSPCAIRFDEENHLALTAKVALKAPHAFQTQGQIALPALVKLNTLLTSLGAPQIQSGRLVSQLEARGELKPWRCEGTAMLNATKVHPSTMPEPADLALQADFAGTQADLKSLEAKLGFWKLALTGVVDDRTAQLSQLRLWQKDTLLVEGHARAPLDFMEPAKADSMPMDVALKADGLKLNEVLAAAGVKGIPPGLLKAEVILRGRLETLEGGIKVNLKDVKVPDAPKAFGLATLDLDTMLRAGRLQTVLKLVQPPLQPLTVQANAPVDVAALAKNPQLAKEVPLQVAVRMGESDLGFVREYASDLIKSLPARLKLSADVTGTVSKPAIQAAVDLDVPEITWAKADMPSVRDVRARLRMQDRLLKVEDLSLMMAGGRVKLGGQVDAQEAANPGLNLKLEAREALVFRDPTTSLRANADITCIGTLQQARVAGLVEAVRGRVFQEIDLMPVLKLPADVPPVPENTQRSEAKLELPPLLKDWTFDLRVKTRDPLLVSGNLANGAISADVRLGGTGAAPQLTGAANIDRLLLKLPFSLVKITKGVVTLNPQKPFDPGLDIRGESRIGSNDIALFIYGDSSNPKTRFTSTPPMSEADIVTLLGTGTTLNGSGSDLAAEAASRAAFLFLSELYRKTFNKKKVVREEPPRLHMTFNPSGADRSNDSVQAAYDLTDHWRVSARFTQTGRMKALLGWVLRFGKAAQAADAP